MWVEYIVVPPQSGQSPVSKGSYRHHTLGIKSMSHCHLPGFDEENNEAV